MTRTDESNGYNSIYPNCGGGACSKDIPIGIGRVMNYLLR